MKPDHTAGNLPQSPPAADSLASREPAPGAPETAARSAPQVLSLSTDGLAIRYGLRVILAGVQFCLTAGDCLVVVGSNGAGKSTLLRCLAGLIRPFRGTVRLEVPFEDAVEFGAAGGQPGSLAVRVGVASHDIELYHELTALENLAFYARLRGLELTRQEIVDRLEGFGLPGRANERVGAFSSGMRQRLRLLFALLHGPPVLLLDEPGSNLDNAGRALVATVVNEQRQRGIVVIGTNEPGEAAMGNLSLRLGGSG